MVEGGGCEVVEGGGEVIGGGSIMRESRIEPSNHTPRCAGGGGVDGSMAVPF